MHDKTSKHLMLEELGAGLERIRQSPKDSGVLKLIVRRPENETREVLTQARLDAAEGLLGDNWKVRGSRSMPDGSANPDMQISVMNARVIALISPDESRWALAGDQLYVDLDLSAENLPPGTRLAVGSAVIEVTASPHTGCQKFAARFGADAMKFVNSPQGRKLNLRGVNAKVVHPGVVCTGDAVQKVATS